MAPNPTIDDFHNAEDASVAASKLEMRGYWNDAITLYHAIAERWPEHQQYVAECVKAISDKKKLSHLTTYDDPAPMTVGEWWVVLLILSIPVLNIIMCLFWAFGRPGNVNRRTYCRAFLIWLLIWLTFTLAISLAASLGLLPALP